MKRILSLALAILSLILEPGAVFANQPPGPVLALAEISILPIMMLFTAFGGGYGILSQRKKRRRGFLLALGVILLVILSFVHQASAFLVCMLFCFIAIIRGITMISWGKAAWSNEEAPEHLKEASPRRLITFGSLLVIGSVFISEMAYAFMYYYPMSPKRIEEALEKYVAYEIAGARIEAEKTGEMRFGTMERDLYAYRVDSVIRRGKVEYGKDFKSVTVYIPPNVTTGYGYGWFPFFPFNYIVSYPSYRGDETGRIRMIRTHEQFEQCPVSAPVVKTVSENDIKNAMADLRKRE